MKFCHPKVEEFFIIISLIIARRPWNTKLILAASLRERIQTLDLDVDPFTKGDGIRNVGN